MPRPVQAFVQRPVVESSQWNCQLQSRCRTQNLDNALMVTHPRPKSTSRRRDFPFRCVLACFPGFHKKHHFHGVEDESQVQSLLHSSSPIALGRMLRDPKCRQKRVYLPGCPHTIPFRGKPPPAWDDKNVVDVHKNQVAPTSNPLDDRRKTGSKPIGSRSPAKWHGQTLVVLPIVAEDKVVDHVSIKLVVSVPGLDIERDHAIPVPDVSTELCCTLHPCRP